jgi:hypothetical protein
MIFNRKKKETQQIISLCNKMISGVNTVKLILYKILSENLYKKKIYNDLDHCKLIAAAATNEIFGCHNDLSLNNYKNNQQIIEELLTDLSITNPGLKQIITDSLRVYVQANWALGSKIMRDTDYVLNLFNRSKERGLFIDGGDMPDPDAFIEMTNTIAKTYGISE